MNRDTLTTARLAELADENARLRSALEFVQIEFKEFLNDDPHSRRVADRIRAALKRKT